MERSSGNFDRAVVERAEVVQVRKKKDKMSVLSKKHERGFRSSWVRTSQVLLYYASGKVKQSQNRYMIDGSLCLTSFIELM